MFKVEIETDNAAFYPPVEFGNKDVGLMNRVMANEIDIIMENITDYIRKGHKQGVCIDSNGNIVGSWSLKN